MKIEISDIMAGIALLLSAFATWRTMQFNHAQKKVISQQEKINQILLKKENTQEALSKQADLGANIIKQGSSKYVLKIFNKGNVTARHIRISFPEGDDIIIQSVIDNIFPLELLEVHQSVDVLVAPYIGSQSKLKIKLAWDDDFEDNREKIAIVTI